SNSNNSNSNNDNSSKDIVQLVGDEGGRRRGRGHVRSGRPKRHEPSRDSTCCGRLGTGRNDEAHLAHGDPRSGPPVRFEPGPAGTASPGHTNLGHDDPGVVPKLDSVFDSPEQL
ncbi:hypothetical protein IscW_ISCW005634, partial [Ixodes scapularis]